MFIPSELKFIDINKPYRDGFRSENAAIEFLEGKGFTKDKGTVYQYKKVRAYISKYYTPRSFRYMISFCW